VDTLAYFLFAVAITNEIDISQVQNAAATAGNRIIRRQQDAAAWSGFTTTFFQFFGRTIHGTEEAFLEFSAVNFATKYVLGQGIGGVGDWKSMISTGGASMQMAIPLTNAAVAKQFFNLMDKTTAKKLECGGTETRQKHYADILKLVGGKWISLHDHTISDNISRQRGDPHSVILKQVLYHHCNGINKEDFATTLDELPNAFERGDCVTLFSFLSGDRCSETVDVSKAGFHIVGGVNAVRGNFLKYLQAKHSGLVDELKALAFKDTFVVAANPTTGVLEIGEFATFESKFAELKPLLLAMLNLDNQFNLFLIWAKTGGKFVPAGNWARGLGFAYPDPDDVDPKKEQNLTISLHCLLKQFRMKLLMAQQEIWHWESLILLSLVKQIGVGELHMKIN